MSLIFDAVTARLVLALARDGSIGRSAERENIAPSAISRRIADLEGRLGLTLFDRSAQGVRLTEAGAVYATECSRIMRMLADLDVRMRALADGRSGVLRVAATTSALSGRLPELLAAYGAAYPQVAIELHEMASDTALAALADARVDITAIADNHDFSHFETEALEDDRVYVIARPDHPLGAVLDIRRPIPFEAVTHHELVGFHEAGALDRLLADAARRLGRRLGKRIQAETFSSLVRLVEAGFGIGFLRATSLHLLAGTDLVAAPLADAWAQRSMRLVWRATTQANMAVEHFRALARQGQGAPAGQGAAASPPQMLEDGA
ncbi:LysR family transcriptional regulator [Aureimonas frigidaquae]|uniref:LysR family transcriptional regulator n=1 Tax=Aureimonas frigidaquae TaxID=424757 RepID=UPI000785DD6F|nr:LysR family transcriptional regulator [Aureimonas frigidaquae]